MKSPWLLLIPVLFFGCRQNAADTQKSSPFPIHQDMTAVCNQLTITELSAYRDRCEDLYNRISTIKNGRGLPMTAEIKLLPLCVKLQEDGCIMCVTAPPEITEEPRNVRFVHRCTVLNQP